MFDHEKLQVYGKALDFAAKAGTWTSTWDKKHALVDHLSRATESLVLNLAEAARQRGTPARLRIVWGVVRIPTGSKRTLEPAVSANR